MRKGDAKLFWKDKQKLYESMVLRRSGWTLNALAVIYNCDRTSIRNNARKFVIFPIEGELFNPVSISSKVIVILTKDEVKKPESYSDYLKKEYPTWKKASYR